MIEFIREIFLLRWLWSLFAGFYLLAYTFWIPNLFDNLIISIPLAAVTLLLAMGLMLEGFWRALDLKRKTNDMPILPQRRLWQIFGGILLLGYLLVYVPPEGRIVAHWALDLAITIVAATMMFVFASKRRESTHFIQK